MRADLRPLATAFFTVALLASLSARADLPAEDIQLPHYQVEVLDNGLTLLVMERHTVPLVSFEVWIDAGATADPTGKEGLAALVSSALRKGAGQRNAADFAQALDHLGAEFATSVDHDRTRLSLNLLAKDVDAGLELLADALLRPRFDEIEVARLAQQFSEEIAQAKDNPRRVLSNYYRAFLYGDHPYGRPTRGTETSVAALTAKDARRFHRHHYGSNRTLVALVGDIDSRSAIELLTSSLGSMEPTDAPPVELTPPDNAGGGRVLLVNKNDTPQTWFMMGGLGPSWKSPDYAAVEVVRTVFGGRFTSWLNTALRIESGLTYGASFRMQRGRSAGPAFISSFTATETTREAIDLALAQLKRLHAEGIDAEALASAKAYLKGQTPYDYETGADLARLLCQLTFYDLGRDWIESLFTRIDQVDLEACAAAIQRWFPQNDLVFATVGVESEVGEVLSAYGPVTVRQNEDPGFR